MARSTERIVRTAKFLNLYGGYNNGWPSGLAMLNFPTGKLPRGYNTITLNGIGRLKEILYTGDLETCKYMADKHATGIVRVVVVNERGQLQYSA